MEFVLSEDQRFIRDEARRFLAGRADSAALRRVIAAGTGLDAPLWAQIRQELGWCAMAIPEALGGLGLGLTELAILHEAAGERLLAAPLWATAGLAAPLLGAWGSAAAQAAWLPRIGAGEITATLAMPRLDGDPFAPAAVARAEGSGWRLDGEIAQVPAAEAADLILVVAEAGGAPALFAVTRESGAEIARLPTLDASRQMGRVALRGVILPAAARLDDPAAGAAALAAARIAAALGHAAEQAGVARGAMDLTLAYIAERRQFGRPIASFQAVKHRCARLEVDLAELRALVYGCAAALDAGEGGMDELSCEAGAALALASDLAFRAAEEAIQLHGGVGFTWDYDPHLYLRRAQAAAALLGPPEAHLERIAARLLEGGAA